MKPKPKTFKAAYSRTGVIWVDDGNCYICEEAKPCLFVDFSEDEYGPGIICLECINKMFPVPNITHL